jgi:RHS repeat-associated protein
VNTSASADPIVSVSYDGPDASGHGTLTVNYNFRNTDSPAQRIIDIVSNLAAPSNFYQRFSGFTAQSGSFTVPINFTCRTGNFFILARAVACDRWSDPNFEEWSNTVDVAASADPKVTVSFASEDDRRHGLLTVNYEFPDTDSPNQRTIDIVSDLAAPSNFYARYSGLATRTGSFTVLLNMACRTGDSWVRARAVACDRWSDPNFEEWSEPQVITGNHTPSLSLTPELDSSTGQTRAILIDYDFPQTNSSSQRLIRLVWQPGGEQIAEYRPSDGKGQIRHELPACVPRLRDTVDAFATACGDVTVPAAVPVVLPSCDFACSTECPDCFGKPIRATNGNMRMSDRDPLPGDSIAPLQRTYDSQDPTELRFGRGWSSIFDAFLRSYGGSDGRETVLIHTAGGERYLFRRTAGVYGQAYPAGERVNGILTYDGASATFIHREGAGAVQRIYRASDGRLVGIREIAGVREGSIAYTAAGLPQRVASANDAWAWDLATDGSGRVSTISVSGRPDLVWTYTYNAGQLVAVTAPGGVPWRTYTYASSGLAEARDGAGNLIESHTYDAAGRAISSGSARDDVGGVSYNLPGRVAGETLTRVTYTSGRTTDYYSRLIAGKMRTVQIDGSCDCGAEDTVYGHDNFGRITREQNAQGYITLRTFSPGTAAPISVETAYKPVGCDPATDAAHCRLDPGSILTATLERTAATEVTRYQYGDLTWPDQPTAIVKDSVLVSAGERVEELVYHPETGQVLSHTVTGSTETGNVIVTQSHRVRTILYGAAENAPFNPGGSFTSAWLTLPQPQSLRKSVDRPRTDVDDATTFVYYPIDSSVPSVLRGRVAAARNAAGHMTRYENYDVFGNVTRVVDANGVAAEMTYDALGRLLTSTTKGVADCDTAADPLCATDLSTTRVYSPPAGPLQIEARAGGGVTRYEYDERGRVKTVSRGPFVTDLREALEYTYDPLTGRKQTERLLARENNTWVEKKSESYAYDALAQLRRITHADSTFLEYTYDPEGRIETVRDENHAAANTSYAYDPAGRVVTVKQSMITTRYTYDVHGNLTTVTDPNGNTTSYRYDDFGRLLSQQSAVTGTTTYQYDSAGNLIELADANSTVTSRSYDVLNRVTNATSVRSGVATETVTYLYDEDPCGMGNGTGRLTTMSDPAGVSTYCYERRGLLALEDRSSTYAGESAVTTIYGYDADGNRESMVYPSGRKATYAFDFADRPLGVAIDGIPLVVSASYLPFGPPAQWTFGNGTTRVMTFDNRYRPLTNQLHGPSGTIAHYQYVHDGVGNITQIVDGVDGGYTRTFTYDDLNRLTGANTGASLWGAASYQYDAMGNLTAHQLGSSTLSFAYVGMTPRLQSVTGTSTTDVQYDPAGNETERGAFQYNARNQLSVIADPDPFSAPRITYGYDGRGLRVSTLTTLPGVPQNWGSRRRRHVYSPELHLLAESDWTSPQTGPQIPGALQGTEYIWLGDGPVAQTFTDPMSATRYTFTDPLNTPLLQTDDSAAVVWRAEYEPYGDIYVYRAGDAADPQRLRLPGQEAQEIPGVLGTDLYYNIFRWYRAGWGRYTQADPISLAGGMNLYRYAGDDPIGYADPLGLVTWSKNAPVYHGADWDTVFKNCKDWSAHGCTIPFVHVGCKCACSGGSFRASVDLTMNINVWARNDDPKASLVQIINEETKHVWYFETMFKWAIKRGEQLEGKTFSNKKDCDDACKAFYSATYNDFADDWVHKNNPHPNY